MNARYEKFYPRALYKGRRVWLSSMYKGWYEASIDLDREAQWLKNMSHESVRNFFPRGGCYDRDGCTGEIPVDSPDLVFDNTGRMSAEVLTEGRQLINEPASYKGRRVRVSREPPSYFGDKTPYVTLHFRMSDGEDVPDTADWMAVPVISGRDFFYRASASEFPLIKYDAGYAYKMAYYKTLCAIVNTIKHEECTVDVVVPESAQYENMEWIIGNFQQKWFDTFSGILQISDPGLYIDDTEIIREDLLTHTFPVNWRAAEYKGCKIKVGAHSDTHHFVTHHADILLPRGVIPTFLSSVTATQTGPQDFMAKIPISDPDLIFTNPPQS